MRFNLALIFLSAFFLLHHPSSFSQWTQTSGPEGGHVSAIISHNGFVFAGTNGAGNMRSSDGGITWTEVNTDYGYPFVTSYLVKGTALYSATVNVYQTTDDGTSWTSGTGLPTGNSVTCLATDGTRIYAGISAGFATLGVFRSTDDGMTWVGSSTGLPDYAAIISLCVSGSTVFATASGSVPGIYRSTDMGLTWGLSGTGSSGIYPGPLLVSGGMLYAATSNSGVYRSTDNGDSWQPSNNGLPASTSIYALQEHAGAVYAATLTYPIPAGMYKTTDNGANVGGRDKQLPSKSGNVCAWFSRDSTSCRSLWKRNCQIHRQRRDLEQIEFLSDQLTIDGFFDECGKSFYSNRKRWCLPVTG